VVIPAAPAIVAPKSASASEASAGFRFAHIKVRTVRPAGRAEIGSPLIQRLRSDATSEAEA
jgi:hypothetical protein